MHELTGLELSEKLVPQFVVDFVDGLRFVGAGVVDQDVDLAHRLEARCGEPGRVGSTAKVGHDVLDSDLEPRADLADGSFELVLMPAGDDDIGPGLGQPTGHCLAQALAAAGHKGHASG